MPKEINSLDNIDMNLENGFVMSRLHFQQSLKALYDFQLLRYSGNWGCLQNLSKMTPTSVYDHTARAVGQRRRKRRIRLRKGNPSDFTTHQQVRQQASLCKLIVLDKSKFVSEGCPMYALLD